MKAGRASGAKSTKGEPAAKSAASRKSSAGKGGKGGEDTGGRVAKGKDSARQGSGKHATKSQKQKSGRESTGGTGGKGTKGGKGGKAEKGGKGGARRGGGVRFGIAIKFAIPVAILMIVVIATLGVVISRKSTGQIVNEILKAGVVQVTMLAEEGNRMIAARSLDGRRWAETLGYLSGGTVTEEEKQPDKVILRQGLLRNLTIVRENAQSGKSSQIVAAYVRDSRGAMVARSEESKDIPEGEEGRLFIKSKPNWLPTYADISSVDMGGHTIVFKSSPYEVSPGWIGDTKILKFKAPIYQGGNPVGEAIIGLRAGALEDQVAALNKILLLIGIIGTILAIVVVVGVALTVSKPIKVLLHDMEVVAGGDLGHKTRATSSDEVGALAVEFNHMTHSLLEAQKAEAEIQRVENELELAREIQMKLLPPRLPSVRGFDMFATYKPAREVGGDYYDFFPIDKVRMGIIVADVSGKGIPGSMVMATTRTILRFVAAGNTSASDTLAKTNQMVAADIRRGMFVTAFYLVLDAREKTLLCSSAGHNPMVVMRASGELEQINPNGIALGFDKGAIFNRTIKEQAIKLESGDRIVLYTDGVVEAMNAKNEEYTDERFYEFVKKHDDLNSEKFVQALLADLERHKGRAEQHDDITIVTLKVQ